MTGEKEQKTRQVVREEAPPKTKKSTRDKSLTRDSSQELEARLARVNLAIADLRDDSAKVEEMSENVELLEGKAGSCQTSTDELREEVLERVNELFATFREELVQLKGTFTAELQAVKEEVVSMKADITLCKVAAANENTYRDGPRLKVPEPPKFEGKTDSKTLDNFSWSVKRYFKAMHLGDDASKITTATLYLIEDAIFLVGEATRGHQEGVGSH